jgi:TubC N-terminal docking domain
VTAAPATTLPSGWATPAAAVADPAGTLDLLARLGALGAQLEADGDRLRLDAPRGALTPDLVAEVRRQKAALLVLVSGAWRADLEAWPLEARDAYEERAAILEHMAGFSRDEAERWAFVEASPQHVWHSHASCPPPAS